MRKYDLLNKVTSDGYVYICTEKGMYGLKQAAILTYEHLKETLDPNGYTPVIGTVGLWKHNTLPTNFCLYVEDFEIKHFSKPNAQHLLNIIGRTYTYTTDWDGKITVISQSIRII